MEIDVTNEFQELYNQVIKWELTSQTSSRNFEFQELGQQKWTPSPPPEADRTGSEIDVTMEFL